VGAQIIFPESGRGLGHATPTIFGSTVGYLSDSLASCSLPFRVGRLNGTFWLDQIQDGSHEVGARLISEGRVAYLSYEEAGNKRAAVN